MRNQFRLISALTRGIWLIEPEAAHSYAPLLASLLKGEDIQLTFENRGEQHQEGVDENAVYVVSAQEIQMGSSGSTVSVSRYRSLNDAPPRSVAVIPLNGPLMKNDGCYSVGMATRAQQIMEADEHPKIIGTIMVVDTPGGTFDGTPHLSQTVLNTKKPFISFVDGSMCSAGYFAGCGADEVWASQPTDMIGSIGTMISFADIQPALEKQGVKFHEIYADASTEKNLPFAEARKGNYKALKQELLNPVNEAFLSTVISNRSDKGLNQETTLKGKVFLATQAQQEGLIDRIGTFDEAVQRIYELADSPKSASQSPSQSQSNSTNMFGNKYPKLSALKNVAADQITLEQIDAVNEELRMSGLTGITVVNAAIIAEAEKVGSDLVTAKDQLIKANADLKTAQDQVTTLTKERDDFKQEAEKLGAQPGATHTTPGKQGQEQQDSGAVDLQSEIDNLPHNQAADANILIPRKAK